MAGSRSSRLALSLDCVFFTCAPLPGSAFVVWQRQPWVALGFHSFYLATTEECEPLIPQLKYKSQAGSDWPSLNHMLIADYYGQGAGVF